MNHWQTYRYGNLVGTMYKFPKRGDGIPMHGHNVEDIHNVICLKGKCLLYGPNKEWEVTLDQGEIYHFAPHEYPHEIAALEEDCVILNLCAHGDKFDHLRSYGYHGENGIDERPLQIPLD